MECWFVVLRHEKQKIFSEHPCILLKKKSMYFIFIFLYFIRAQLQNTRPKHDTGGTNLPLNQIKSNPVYLKTRVHDLKTPILSTPRHHKTGSGLASLQSGLGPVRIGDFPPCYLFRIRLKMGWDMQLTFELAFHQPFSDGR